MKYATKVTHNSRCSVVGPADVATKTHDGALQFWSIACYLLWVHVVDYISMPGHSNNNMKKIKIIFLARRSKNFIKY